MAGTKKKSALSESAGATAENGRNKMQSVIERKIAEYITGNFDSFIADIEELDVKERVKVKADLIKLVVPRAANDDSPETPFTQSPLISKLFARDSSGEIQKES